jgi:GDPmannose 4,6-dehydratase
MKRALITGITGQDGSYLAELLLEKGYEVHGIIRRSSLISTARIDHLYQDPHEKGVRLRLHYGDLSDDSALERVLRVVKPDEIYNLGAQSHVRTSFDIPEYTADVGALGPLRILEGIREAGISPRFYQASSSEVFGNATEVPQTEKTPLSPRSPYGCAKAFGAFITTNYREAHGIFAVNGFLFNHESPRRGETFVSRKITKAVARIKLGLQNKLYLGNLDAKRDWGYAPEYVDAIWRMMQLEKPEDFVIATGENHSVREFVEEAFAYQGLDWKRHVEIDAAYHRPTEINDLLGDASKAKRLLGWEPKVTFHSLVRIMVDADLRRELKERGQVNP